MVWGLGGLKYVHAVGADPYCGVHKVIDFKTLANFGKIHYRLPRDSSVWGKFGIFTVLRQPKPLAATFHALAERMTGARWLKTRQTPTTRRRISSSSRVDVLEEGMGLRPAEQPRDGFPVLPTGRPPNDSAGQEREDHRDLQHSRGRERKSSLCL